MCSQGNDSPFCPPRPSEEPAPDGTLLRRAPAKLNLFLRVLDRRPDGYHEIDSIAAKVTLFDELIFRLRTDGQVRLECSGLDCGPPVENLVLHAAELLRPMAPGRGAAITLRKQIPPGAGLGGGSSDAAVTLEALSRLWQLQLPGQALAELGSRLGSDVPLFMNGPAVRVRGRGERVEPVEVHPFFAVLCLSDLSCRTADVYARCDRIREDAGGSRPAGRTIDLMARFRRPPSVWRGELFNDLRSAAVGVCPGLAGVSERLAAATGLPVHLTGSGSGLFLLTDDEAAAHEALAGVPAELKGHCRVVSLNAW